MTNVTGWNELMSGNISQAAFVAMNEPLGGYLILILFALLSLLLYYKTQNIELTFTIDLIFFAVFAVVGLWVTPLQYGIVITILVFELGAVLFKIFTK